MDLLAYTERGVSRVPLLSRYNIIDFRLYSSGNKTNNVKDKQPPEAVSFETSGRTSENPVWSIKDQASHKTKLSGSHEHDSKPLADSSPTPTPTPTPTSSPVASTTDQVHVGEGRMKSNSPVWSTVTDNYSGGATSKKEDKIDPSATFIPKRKYSTSSSKSSNTDKSAKRIDVHSDIYPPSTVENQTPISSKTDSSSTQEQVPSAQTTERTVWSAQRLDTVHTPGTSRPTTAFIPSSTDASSHRSTVYSPVGDINIADPFKTKNVLPTTSSKSSSNTISQPVSPPKPSADSITTTSSVNSTSTQDQPPLSEKTERTIWSAQRPDTVHTPGSSSPTTTFIPSSSDALSHRSTVYSPTGDINVTDPFDTSVPVEMASLEQRKSNIPPSAAKTFGGQDTSISSFRSTPTTADTNNRSTERPIQSKDQIRNEILREALKIVNEKGWSMDAIREGVRTRGHPSTVESLFSSEYDLVDYVVNDANKAMVKYMRERKEKGNINTEQLLVDGLKYRLSFIIPYTQTWNQALALGAIPQNAFREWKNLLDLADKAWHTVGDNSTDIDWYTKRLLLAAVYKSAEIYMVQDSSPDKANTLNYLDSRLNDFSSMANAKDSVGFLEELL
ncbi:unnamed protein product [Didymodactylos carnosus]|uniref:Ubiquinone biosynthesis protein n=1 Tax=Didymodactylos carnosus TaxID=1234261 RepID=A0A813SJJ9_9BILA|nr:unnamed protein product [Didymodactylos carnosus]CAF0796919.1 unnamed protein product [Didymodactylos carnosus]CAF3543342.1 unnamed protein product [Didymodactylos carnosus]CAF3581636.1 unnamed protein product [Didymodactylos carnosus]